MSPQKLRFLSATALREAFALLMPSRIPSLGKLGVKVVTLFEENVARVVVFDPREEAAREFCREMFLRLGVEIAVARSSSECVRGADIVCAATSSPRPVFEDRDLEPGVHVNAVGSYQPWVQEVPAETVLRASVFVDHRESALSEGGT